MSFIYNENLLQMSKTYSLKSEEQFQQNLNGTNHVSMHDYD